jgi:arylsulfatase
MVAASSVVCPPDPRENMYAPPLRLPLPRSINLLTDLREERDVAVKNTWVAEPMRKIIGEFLASLKKYPPIKVGTADPYLPATVRERELELEVV